MTTPTTRAERRALREDARNRAARTLVQGLGVDVLVAVAAVLLAWLPDADITSGEAWAAIGVVVAKTVLTTLASYMMRLKADPAVTPATLLPPVPQPYTPGPPIPGTTLRSHETWLVQGEDVDPDSRPTSYGN